MDHLISYTLLLDRIETPMHVYNFFFIDKCSWIKIIESVKFSVNSPQGAPCISVSHVYLRIGEHLHNIII